MQAETMNRTTILIFAAMYLYGFSLMIWAIFFDKRPTKRSVRAAKWGLAGLTATLIYFLVMWLLGLEHFEW